MIRYEAVVAGTVIGTYATREEAETRVADARNSYLAMIHPIDTFFVREVVA